MNNYYEYDKHPCFFLAYQAASSSVCQVFCSSYMLLHFFKPIVLLCFPPVDSQGADDADVKP